MFRQNNQMFMFLMSAETSISMASSKTLLLIRIYYLCSQLASKCNFSNGRLMMNISNLFLAQKRLYYEECQLVSGPFIILIRMQYNATLQQVFNIFDCFGANLQTNKKPRSQHNFLIYCDCLVNTNRPRFSLRSSKLGTLFSMDIPHDQIYQLTQFHDQIIFNSKDALKKMYSFSRLHCVKSVEIRSFF